MSLFNSPSNHTEQLCWFKEINLVFKKIKFVFYGAECQYLCLHLRVPNVQTSGFLAQYVRFTRSCIAENSQTDIRVKTTMISRVTCHLSTTGIVTDLNYDMVPVGRSVKKTSPFSYSFVQQHDAALVFLRKSFPLAPCFLQLFLIQDTVFFSLQPTASLCAGITISHRRSLQISSRAATTKASSPAAVNEDTVWSPLKTDTICSAMSVIYTLLYMNDYIQEGCCVPIEQLN